MKTTKLSLLPIIEETAQEAVQLPLHPSFFAIHEKLQKWQLRFPIFRNDLIVRDLMLLNALAAKGFLDHRSASHLSRLVLSIHFMQKVLQQSLASFPHLRHLEIHWISGRLSFPFSSKAVLGCVVGLTLNDRYELFDEESVLLILQKNHPELKVVEKSYYSHPVANEQVKILYFEIEKQNDECLSFAERNHLKHELEKHIRSSIQKLAPMVFMRRNEEEVYKMILTLSREVASLNDLPQAWITFEHQTAEEIVFLVILVYVSQKNRVSLSDYFANSQDCQFVLERNTIVRHLQEHPIHAQVFRIHLPRDFSLVRSDGSLDFYASRQKVVSLIGSALGEFRDFNGGTLIKQSELLDNFKAHFPSSALIDAELMDTFFYAITPLEQQALLHCDVLSGLFQDFLDMRSDRLQEEVPYVIEVRQADQQTFLAIHVQNPSWKEAIVGSIEKSSLNGRQLTYTMIETAQGLFFHGVLPRSETKLIDTLREALHNHHKSLKQRQVLRIGGQYALVSLDPRVGGDAHSSDVLRLLFQGLMRIGNDGKLEPGIAESVDVSTDYTRYIFKLRNAYWNDGSPVTAFDFEYSWKTILSPDFKTAFAYLFDTIKYAKEAKRGQVHIDQVGIRCIDERTLQVELTHPTPYFLELTALPLYYPVRQEVDKKVPQWPYQVGSNYPCNGPFQLAVNDPTHQTYQLVKNPYYWDAASVALDEILLTQSNPHLTFQAFQKGELDWIGYPLGGWLPFYVARPEDKTITFPDALTCWLVFNTTRFPFNHPKIRQALALAIDRSDLIANSFIPLTPGYSLIPPRCQHAPSPCFPQYDVTKAQYLLKEALAELKLSLNQLPPFKLTYSKGGIRDQIAERLNNLFQYGLGIQCELEPLHWNSVVSKMTGNDFQIGLMHWLVCIDDPIATLNSFRYSDEGINFSKWDDPDFQNWLNLSDNEVCQTLRASYLMQAEKRLCDQMPIIPLFHQPHMALVRKDLQVVYHHSFHLEKSFYTKEAESKEFPG